MKHALLVTLAFVAILLGALFASQQPASATSVPATQDGQNVVCLPGVYMQNPGDCSPVGPSSYMTRLAESGVHLPLPDLPAVKPDPNLTYVEYNYIRVDANNVPVYGSLQDAVAGNKQAAVRRINRADMTYLSYAEEQYVDGKRFYRLYSGEYMSTVGVVRIGAVPLFQGLQFRQTPKNAFGWILTFLSADPVETKRTPGYEKNDYTGHILNNHEVVQVYDVQHVGDMDWYMVGPDEWVIQNVVARVIPKTTPPQGVTGDRWIEVNLFEQTIAVYDKRQLVFASLIASGIDPFWTRPGLFQIKTKLKSTPMRGAFEADRSDAYFLDDVPWTMYFDEARALHGAYWRTQLGFPQSHGCVNLSVGDSHWIFDWAQEGDWVYVWDPSGKTPEDPSYYTAGGA
jgi:lipoprotein-anchoring transpeptidase ErfK/SrfK